MRYYYGVPVISGPVEVFYTNIKPTESNMGHVYKFCTGAYKTRQEAESSAGWFSTQGVISVGYRKPRVIVN